jgi:hypothetical protein
VLGESARAGAWGIKFQYRNLANAYANDARQIGDEILQKEIQHQNLLIEEILNQLLAINAKQSKGKENE